MAEYKNEFMERLKRFVPMKTRGKKGIDFIALSQETGVPYDNLYSWFKRGYCPSGEHADTMLKWVQGKEEQERLRNLKIAQQC